MDVGSAWILCDASCAVQDVASGVPMAQSTQQLQALLKDMGFASPAPPPTTAPAADPPASQAAAADGAAKQAQCVYGSAADGDGSIAQETLQLQQKQPLLPPPARTCSGPSSGGMPAEQHYQPTALQQSHPPQCRPSQHQSYRSQWKQGQQDSDSEVEQALVAAAVAVTADRKEQNMPLQAFRRQSDREQQPSSAAPYSIPENQNEGGEGGSSGALLAAVPDPLADSHPEAGGRFRGGSGASSRFAGEQPQMDVKGSGPQAVDLPELPTLERRPQLLDSSCLPRQQQQQACADSAVAGGGQPLLLRPPGRSADGSSNADNASAVQLPKMRPKTRPSSAPQVGCFALLC